MKIKQYFYLLFVLFICFSSCQSKEGEIVVRVYDHVLTLEDLQNMIPVFAESGDSIVIKQQYIDAWIAQKVLLHEAEKALSKKEKNFDKEIEEYRQALMVYAYENKRVKELLNKRVSDEEITQYYEKYKNNFKTDEVDSLTNAEKENIVKSILQQRRIQILESLREEAINKAKTSGEILVN